MSRVIFVTGSDTSVGKTVFSAQLILALRERGERVMALKPLASGCVLDDPRGEDGEILWQALGREVPFESVALYRMEAPLAPTVAARLAGVEVDREQIRRAVRESAASYDWVIVEGAGGLLSPLVDSWSFADLATECGGALVVVVGSKLGAINHACLTFEVARSRAIPLLGYVLNELSERDGSEEQLRLLETNRTLLREVASGYDTTELGCIPFIPDIARATSLERASERAGLADTVRRLIESFPS